MTFGVIERGLPLVAELIALAFESAGHCCLMFKDFDQATRALHATHIDSIILSIHTPGRNGLDWLERMAKTRPDLPSRSLLLTGTALTRDEAARIRKLRAEVAHRPSSVAGIELVALARLQRAGSEPVVRSRRGWDLAIPAEYLN